jgi:hypothetical protein
MTDRRHAVVTTPDLSRKAPKLDMPSPFVPEKVAQFTLPGGADDNDKFMSFAFGLVETEGSIRYAVQYGSYLWIVRALCLGEREATIYGAEQAGECDGLVGVYTDTGLFTNVNFSYTWVSGSLSQTVHATLAGVVAALGGTWAETLVITDKTGKRRAISHSIECWSNVAQVWTNGIPKIKYRFRGSRVLNTSTGLVQYTVNPVWQARFWALDPSGGRLRPSRINEGSFQVAAAATPAAQYESHLLLSASVREGRKMFGLLWDGWMVYAGGNQLTAIADRNTAPVATYDDSYFAADQDIEAGPVADPDQMVNSVTIEYTDITDPFGIWKTKALTLRTAGLIAGTETEVPVTFKFPQLHDPAIVNLKLGYLLYAYQAYRIKGKWLANAGGPRLMGDVVTQSVPARGIADNFRVMVRDKQPNGTYAVELELIDARRWAGASATAAAKVGSTLSDPYLTPPTPPPVTLIQEGFNVRVTLPTLTPPYDWYGGQIITVQQSGGFAEYELGRPGSGDLLIKGVTMGSTYTVRSRVVSALFPLFVGLASIATITPSMAQAPDVVNMVMNRNGATPPVVTAYWDAPVYLAANRYGSSFWSQANAGGYVGANVNDGNVGTKAFDWSPAADTTITTDFGSPKELRALRVTFDTSGIGGGVVEFSDNGSAWIAVSNQRFPATLNPPPAAFVAPYFFVTDIGWSPSGSHRYWRWRKGYALSNPTNFSEMQWFEVSGVGSSIDHFDIFDTAGNPVASLDVSALPTISNPWTLPSTMYVYTRSANGAGSFDGGLTVKAVPTAGLSSLGVTASTHSSYSPGAVSAGLSNGLNSNIPIAAYANVLTYDTLVDVSGPSAAFSLGGFDSGYSAKTLTIVNRTGQTMTIVNEDASSTAANRITTQTGGNVSLSSPAIASFLYDAAASRWELVSSPWQTDPSTLAPKNNPFLTGQVWGNDSYLLQKDGSDTVGAGPYWFMQNVATTARWIVQMSASNHYDFWRFSGGAWARMLRLDQSGRLITFGPAPTATTQGTGWGTGATVATPAGSDMAGTITVTAGSGAGNLASIKVTLSAALGTNEPTVLIVPRNGSGAWDSRAVPLLTACSTTDFTVQFDNNGASFVSGQTYKFKYFVFGD